MERHPKDLAFFGRINDDPRLPQPPIRDHKVIANELGSLVYEATSWRLEAGCDNSSPLGTVVDWGVDPPVTPLGALATMARKIAQDPPTELILPLFELLNALMAEGRECGISSEEIPKIRDLAGAYLDEAT